MRVIRPFALRRGDAMGVVMPASLPPHDDLEMGIQHLEKLGFRVVLAPFATAKNGYLARRDSVRVRELAGMVNNPEVKAIICARGGYGTFRILKHIDYALFREHPKIIVGHSDITALQCAIWKRARLITLHGPMVCSDFGRPEISRFTVDHFLKMVFGHCTGELFNWRKSTQGGESLIVVQTGRAQGRLIGGNLSVLCGLIGTPWFPDLRGNLLFVEDVNEPLYRLDRMFTQLIESGSLGGVAGILGGKFAGCTSNGDEEAILENVAFLMKDRFSKLRVPIVVGLPFGHVLDKLTIPFGAKAELNTRSKRLTLLEPVIVGV